MLSRSGEDRPVPGSLDALDELALIEGFLLTTTFSLLPATAHTDILIVISSDLSSSIKMATLLSARQVSTLPGDSAS